MTSPPPAGDGYGYGNQQYGQYTDDQQQQPYGQYDQSGTQPEQPQHEAPAHGKKKKRGYAAGAFEVGTGANAAVGGQFQGGAQQPYGVSQPQTTPAYGGYPQPEAQQPAAPQGYQYPQQGYGAQQPAAPQAPAYGGYQAPDQGYPAPGGQPAPGAPGVAGITQGMGNMSMPSSSQPIIQGKRPAVLNQLYPTDLLNQPFNVSELDLPPPPIVLPANVSPDGSWAYHDFIC